MKLPWSSLGGIMWLLSPFTLLVISGLVTEITERRQKFEKKRLSKANKRIEAKRTYHNEHIV